MSKILQAENLSVVLNEHKILDNISFELKKGETIAILGPNGAGKSVLLKSILGLLPYQGRVIWGKNIKVGYVPQRLAIEKDLPLTTKEFFETKTKDETSIESSLKKVGFLQDANNRVDFNKHILNNKLANLSGGELQRVLIAWSLIDKPDLLLFDEPTSGVDISNEETIYEVLQKLQRKEHLSMIIISHEIQIIYKYATKVICLNRQRLCYGPPNIALENDTLKKLFGKDVEIHKGHIHHHQH
jgi:zinc transport system ATP-binding protein